MVLNEENYKYKINTFTNRDWKPLLTLIPKIENISKFGKWSDTKINKNGILQISCPLEG